MFPVKQEKIYKLEPIINKNKKNNNINNYKHKFEKLEFIELHDNSNSDNSNSYNLGFDNSNVDKFLNKYKYRYVKN